MIKRKDLATLALLASIFPVVNDPDNPCVPLNKGMEPEGDIDVPPGYKNIPKPLSKRQKKKRKLKH